MKTINSRSSTTRPRSTHPEAPSAPARSGVLGTILTELEFGEDERFALNDCTESLRSEFEPLVDVLAERARQVALDAEKIGVNALAPQREPRPSIRNLRRHAARQWLTATLAGVFDAAFSRQLRHTWMPILLADPQHNRASGAAVAAFLDYVEGYVACIFIAETSDNLVPGWSQFHAFRTALDVQRRVFGIER